MKNLHIRPDIEGWSVGEEDAPHSFATFKTKTQAIEAAADILDSIGGILTIFGPDGEIEYRAATFPRDPTGQHWGGPPSPPVE